MKEWRGTFVELLIVAVLGAIAWKHEAYALHVIIALAGVGGVTTARGKMTAGIAAATAAQTELFSLRPPPPSPSPKIPPGIGAMLGALAIALFVWVPACTKGQAAADVAAITGSAACKECAIEATCVLVQDVAGKSVCATAEELAPLVGSILGSRAGHAQRAHEVPFVLRARDAGAE